MPFILTATGKSKAQTLKAASDDSREAAVACTVSCTNKKLFKPVLTLEKGTGKPGRLRVSLNTQPGGFGGEGSLDVGPAVKLFTSAKSDDEYANRVLAPFGSEVKLFVDGVSAGTAELKLWLSKGDNRATGEAKASVKVKAVNVVTPTLKFAKEATWFATGGGGDPVKVNLGYEEAPGTPKFSKGATLSWDAACVSVYRDQECTKNLSTPAKLTHKEMQGLELWVKGAKEAKSKLKLEMEDPKKSLIQCAKPVEKELAVTEANLVTAKLKLEHKVALVEPAGRDGKQPDATKLYADPTWIEIALDQTKPDLAAYTKNVLVKFDSGKIKLYKENTCKTEAGAGGQLSIPGADLWAAKDHKQQFWARGIAPGKFKIKVEFEDPANPLIQCGKAVEEEFGAVRLELGVHEYASASPFAAAAMSEDNRIGGEIGRLLHTQSAKNDFARAKLVIKAVAAGDWPPGTDAYEIALTQDSKDGAVKVWTAEQGGKETALPYKIARSKLTADQVLWVQGATASKAKRDVRLYLGVQDKKNGDWARFTVVTISEVKPATEFAAATTEYTNGKFRHIINAGGADTREIEIGAKLSAALEKIPIHFLLIEDANNRKEANWGVDMPGTWTWASIPAALKHNDQDGGLHKHAETDNKGIAKVKLKLSQFGGDKLKAGAFLSQDPQFRTYTASASRKPVLSNDIQVWRRLWFQVTKPKSMVLNDPANAVTAYEQVRTELKKTKVVDYDPNDGGAPAAVKSSKYKKWMLEPGAANTDVVVIGSQNFDPTFTGMLDSSDAAKKPIAHVVVCEAQWDAKGYTGATDYDITSFSDATGRISHEIEVSLGDSRGIVSPPLDGGDLLNGGKGTWANDDGSQTGDIPNDHIIIERNRSSVQHIKVKLPVGAPTPTSAHPITVTLDLKQASGPWLGESQGTQIMAVYDSDSSYADTVTHEIGHSIYQAYANSPATTGVPAHPKQYQKNGSHCKSGILDYCVMYESGPNSRDLHRFCKVCRPYVVLQDLTAFKP